MSADHGTSLDEALAVVTGRAKRYAERGPYRLFPDEVVVRNVLAKMAMNLVEHGKAYCPCREVSGDPEPDRANVCPCRSHHGDIARDGYCECRLFVSQEFLRARDAADRDQEA